MTDFNNMTVVAAAHDGQRLVDVVPKAYLTKDADDPDNCAYTVGLEWQKAVGTGDACEDRT